MFSAVKSAISFVFANSLFAWVLVVLGLFLGFLTDLPNYFALQLANWSIDHAETFMQWLLDSGLIPDIAIGSIPQEFGAFIGYLRIDECFGIILTAYAIRFTRKRFF